MEEKKLIVRRCLECKRLFEDYPGAVLLQLKGNHRPSEEIDLCIKCRVAAGMP
ncbi:MAG: hypothetical protein ACREF4_06220 [Gammaproteobacteria bacterium]